MADIPPEEISDYACEDADITLQLYGKLSQKVTDENLTKLAEETEFPLVEVLSTMELNGVALNLDALSDFSVECQQQLDELTKKVHEETGVQFNLDSPKQLGEILFEKMEIPPVKKTKTGYSTDVSVLEKLASEYPVARLLVEYRQLAKLQSTYITALPKLVNKRTGRIHTTYNQTVASTGRLSSVEPNLQNIPIRTALGRRIRKAFVPQHNDSVLLAADYSQIELRIMAYVSKDETLVDAFRTGKDIHSATAATLFDLDIENVDKDQRRIAKTVNFGIMYGQGAFGLAQQLGISRKESKEIITNYFEKYPRIKEYFDTTIEFAKEHGYVETLDKRRRYFPALTHTNHAVRTGAERAAINMPIQGTAADMLKKAMIAIHRRMKEEQLQSMMMLQVHDELVFESPKSEIEYLQKLVKTTMESVMTLGDVPVVAETGIGQNWDEAH
jgi:DNA polymerase-1